MLVFCKTSLCARNIMKSIRTRGPTLGPRLYSTPCIILMKGIWAVAYWKWFVFLASILKYLCCISPSLFDHNHKSCMWTPNWSAKKGNEKIINNDLILFVLGSSNSSLAFITCTNATIRVLCATPMQMRSTYYQVGVQTNVILKGIQIPYWWNEIDTPAIYSSGTFFLIQEMNWYKYCVSKAYYQIEDFLITLSL